MLKEFVSASLAALQLVIGCATDIPSENQPPDNSYIIHAAGSVNGLSGTNSLEALENAYENGNRYIEIDFSFSSDLKPVCIHDWNYVSYPGYDGIRPTYYEFSQSRVYSSFTPLTLESVASFMSEHKDLYIITDVKDYNIYFSGIVKRDFPELCDRFIIQVYSEEQYEYISKLGFENIIFSLYRLDWRKQLDTNYLVSFAKSNPLYAYTFDASLCANDGYVEEMLKSGIPLFVHTVNDKQEQQKYFDMGITGIYTDNTIHE